MTNYTKAKGEMPKESKKPASDFRYPPTKPISDMPQYHFEAPKAKQSVKQGVYAPTHINDLFDEEQPVFKDKPEADEKHKKTARREKAINRDGVVDITERTTKNKTDKRPKLYVIVPSILIICGLLAAGFFVFLVQRIKVTGNDKYTADLIIKQSGLETGELIFFTNLEAAKARLSIDPYINVISIKRDYPNCIKIEICERKEVAAIEYMDYYVIIDHDGCVLSIDRRDDLNGLLQISGIKTTGYQVNKPLGTLSDFSVSTTVSLIKALEAHKLMQRINVVDVSNPLKIQMTTADGLVVLLGQPDNIDQKLQMFIEVMPEIRSRQWFSGILDLSAKGDPVYCAADSADCETLLETNDQSDVADSTVTNEFTDIQENN